MLLLYSSRYGAAKEYADRLAGMRDCDILESKSVKLTQLRAYQTIIWMGGVYAGQIEGLETLQRYYRKLTDQQIAVFAVGAAPDDSGLALAGDLSEVPLYYGRGRWDMEALSWKDQMMINMLKAGLKKKPDAVPPWLAELMECDTAQDFIDDIYLEPLLDFIAGR